jgi:hypothetical protein
MAENALCDLFWEKVNLTAFLSMSRCMTYLNIPKQSKTALFADDGLHAA